MVNTALRRDQLADISLSSTDFRFTPKADMDWHSPDVRFVPKAEIMCSTRTIAIILHGDDWGRSNSRSVLNPSVDAMNRDG